MHAVRRKGPRALQQLQGQAVRRPQQLQSRPASDSTHASKPHDPAPTNEGFGISFYMVLAAIPACVLIYKTASQDASGEGNPLSRLIKQYSTRQETWREMNALHTRMVEQAGHDRNLFNNTPNASFFELRAPDNIQRAGTLNVRAGWGSAPLDDLVAHYREKAFAEEEEKLQQMREGKLPGQANYEDLAKAGSKSVRGVRRKDND